VADYSEPVVRRPLCGVQRIGDDLWFFGDIDESNADELAARAATELRTGVVGLNLSQVRFFAAAGVRLLFAARTATGFPDGGVPVVCSAQVMRTLRLCRYTRVDGLRVSAAPDLRNGARADADARPHGDGVRPA
jgi:anti-anti-sigma regulatory factor